MILALCDEFEQHTLSQLKEMNRVLEVDDEVIDIINDSFTKSFRYSINFTDVDEIEFLAEEIMEDAELIASPHEVTKIKDFLEDLKEISSNKEDGYWRIVEKDDKE